MPSAEFEPLTPATKRPQTYALDRAASEVGGRIVKCIKYHQFSSCLQALFRHIETIDSVEDFVNTG
jgi:hypothetical protein